MIKSALINADKDIHVCGTCQNIYDDINQFLEHKLKCPLNKKSLGLTEASVDPQPSFLDLDGNEDNEVENSYLLQFDEGSFKEQFEKVMTSDNVFAGGGFTNQYDSSVNDFIVSSNNKCNQTKKKQKRRKVEDSITAPSINKKEVQIPSSKKKAGGEDKTLKEKFKPIANKKVKNICDICGFVGAYRRDLLRHKRKHTGERPYSCCYCDKKFARKDKLVNHERIHLGDKRFKCGECEYAATDSGALSLHRLIHTGERRHCCQMCSYRARSASHLTVHLRTHTGDSPYFCRLDTCGRSFKTSTDLNRHMKTHKHDVFSSYKDKPQSYSYVYNSEKVLSKTKSCCICQDFIASQSTGRKRGCRPRQAVCVRSHECSHCDAAFVRPDSLRCHVKLHNLPAPGPGDDVGEQESECAVFDPPSEQGLELNQFYAADHDSLVPLETLMQCAIDTSNL